MNKVKPRKVFLNYKLQVLIYLHLELHGIATLKLTFQPSIAPRPLPPGALPAGALPPGSMG